ncbi:MAG: hypothetical protein G01um101418_457 [Parcubacteria group bacterium Gr01-1014_18]|nr:MAG: hypothetical protein Greene041636_502 [Parcubacteria group bacterium Greene0416_36]TSC81044.1 MAG: hypothetical protein G01um101418_457 [Parcubacteria group bacterium Gr01-1014_18]TSC98966.1 MAG: hypothetical protein Greene101420_478 [Parcubacteria group bacterium Greene1014_20]TSD06742.1 MAG: hypothetical protein Greene07142_663 [Parcubacteria group bacterium Greene0714_2]
MKHFISLQLALGVIAAGLFISVPMPSEARSANILRNGSFDKGIEFWDFWSFGCSVTQVQQTGYPINCGNTVPRREVVLQYEFGDIAPIVENKSALRVIIPGEAQDVIWKTNLQTTGDPRYVLSVDSGKMMLRFWARSSAKFGSSVSLNETFDPYKGLGLYQEFDITQEWKEYKYVFDSTPSTSATLVFNMGFAPIFTQVLFDQVDLFYVAVPVIATQSVTANAGDEISLAVTGVAVGDRVIVTIPVYGDKGENKEMALDAKVISESEVRVKLPANTRTGLLKLSVAELDSNSIFLMIKPKLGNNVFRSTLGVGAKINLEVSGISANKKDIFVEFPAVTLSGENIVIRQPVDSVSLNRDQVSVTLPMGTTSGEIRLGTDQLVGENLIRQTSVVSNSIILSPVVTQSSSENKVLKIYGYGFGPSGQNKTIEIYNNNGLLVEKIIATNNRLSSLGELVSVNLTTPDASRVQLVVGNYASGQVTINHKIAVSGETIKESATSVPSKVTPPVKNTAVKPLVKAITKVQISKFERMTRKIGNENKGIIYIHGKNFGSKGGVKVGSAWAEIFYRRDDFIIAAVPASALYGKVIVAKQ